MPKINVLSEDLINKIAAGEVIERPASVVKELIENSLDAGSTQITVDIKDSGKKLIKITDNGEGMDEADARNSIIRHATSKISTASDLFSIQTLGFRGEALASIAAVSQLSIITKQQEKMEGFNIVIEGGKEISAGIIATEHGTTIEVRNLFFNTPARMKFLKTDAVELRHIIDVVTQYALINPHVAFKLRHESRELLSAPAVDNMRNNIAAIYGINVAKDLLEVSYNKDNLQISGFITKPYNTRNDKHQQILFVNERWVKNEDITKAVYDGYHSLLFVGKHPIFVLSISLDPEKIDVNVHPQKSEIKIEQVEAVTQAVQAAIKETLQKNNLFPVIDFEFESDTDLKKPKKDTKYSFESSTQKTLEINDEPLQESQKETPFLQEPPAIKTTSTSSIKTELDEKPSINETKETKEYHNPNFPQLKIFGQIHKTFFLAETPGGIFFIDQHAAHERVMYEQFMSELMQKNVATQSLLQSELVNCTLAEKELLESNKEHLQQFGFTIEHFGENTYRIKTIPSIFGRLQAKDLLLDLLHTLEKEHNTLHQAKEIIVTRMACRSAVMAGDELTNPWMEKILSQLSKTELPFTCPHGRPTMIKTTVDELEKKFRRK